MRGESMAGDLNFLGTKVTDDMLVKIDTLKAKMQAENPGQAVSRSDVVRYCIASATSTADMGLEPVRVPDTRKKK